MSGILKWLGESWASFIDGDPFSTFASAAMGAFAGAVATSWRERRRAVIQEINNINAARTLSFSICNGFIAQKKQHIRGLKKEYDAARTEFIKAQAAAAAAPGKLHVVELSANYGTLTQASLPIAALQSHVLEKISMTGRGLMCAVQLGQVYDAFNRSIADRNTLSVELREGRQKHGLSDKDVAYLYFGLPTVGGRDDRFKDNLTALSEYADDGIFFSKLLAEDLGAYGKALRRRNRWRVWSLPRIGTEDWSDVEKEGLLPPAENYAAWLSAFAPRKSRLSVVGAWLGKRWRYGAFADVVGTGAGTK
ncbi:hypothetical protein [Undibacter mobilis]|uniref:Uncharacterized protein n=1 Tax=Undibacter mobilis TaxID=2292256 RepID=A0A371B0V5_9BRAD|nr:hypothetical protein [Undibacter mobilis]RDV01172.1 hypothetical protein DXH78_18225 [Undibacter mobilis]